MTLATLQRAVCDALASGSDAFGVGLCVHRNTGALARQEALADNHPVVRALLGEAAFAGCAAAFVAGDAAHDPRLSHYGADFADFLGNYAPAGALPWLADVVRLERLRLAALFAADATALDADMLLAGGIDGNRCLALHPSVGLAIFGDPIGSIWLAHRADGAVGLADIAWRAETVRVSRPEIDVIVTVVDPAAAAFLAACGQGASMTRAAMQALDADPDADLAALFARLLAAGAFQAPPPGDIA